MPSCTTREIIAALHDADVMDPTDVLDDRAEQNLLALLDGEAIR